MIRLRNDYSNDDEKEFAMKTNRMLPSQILLAMVLFACTTVSCEQPVLSSAGTGGSVPVTAEVPTPTPPPAGTFVVPQAPSGFTYYHDVVIGTGGTRSIKLEICAPSSDPGTRLPVIAGIHGGGWNKGSKDDYKNKIVDFAEAGYVGVSIDYRLTSEPGSPVFPAQLEDCKLAIRYLKAHAETYFLNPDKIAVWGSSAGSHLAALVGTTGDQPQFEGTGGWQAYSSAVACVVDFFGPADFTTQWANDYGSVTSLLGATAFGDPAKALAAMPGTYASSNDAPFLILHGTADPIVPYEQSTVFRDQLITAGVDVTFGPVKDAGHGFSDPYYEWTGVLAHEFIAHHLKGTNPKPTNPPANPTPTPVPTALPARPVDASVPIGNWKLDETAGSYMLNDASIYAPGVHLANKGTGFETGASGLIGKALRLTDGKTFFINDDPDNRLHVADLSQTNSMSLETWVKFDTLPSVYAYKADGVSRTDVKLMYKVSSVTVGGVKQNAGYELMVSYADNAPQFKLWSIAGSSTVKSTAKITEVNRWYHVVATYDGATMKIYLDGVLAGTLAKTNACSDAVAVSMFRIGGTSNSDANGVKGFMDEVRVYNAPMSDAQVLGRFNAR